LARPKKSGLDYFPLDVDFFEDEKMLAISGEFSVKGEVIVLRILCEIYRNGYFVEYSGLLKNKLARLGGLSGGLVDEVVRRLVEYEFFDGFLFCERKILTSKAIQQRYAEATKRRQNCDSLPFWMTDGVNVNKNPTSKVVNVDINPLKESKVNETKEESPPTPPRGSLSGVVFQNADFSFLPESLQNALADYWAVRAQSPKPVFAIQQELMVKKLLTEVNGDFAEAERWVTASAAGGWQGIYPPKEKQFKPDKSKGAVGRNPANDEKYKKFNTEMEFY
jgi:hypothetical protein